MTGEKIRIELAEDELRAVLDVIAERISATNENDTPLFRAEREFDSALLAREDDDWEGLK